MIIPIVYAPMERDGYFFTNKFQSEFEKAVVEKKHLYLEIPGNNYQSFDYDTLFQKRPRLVIVMATQRHWLIPALHFFQEKKIGVLLLGENPSPEIPVRGSLTTDFDSQLSTLLKHLEDCGCTKTALYNVFENSVPDCEKRRFFVKHLSQKGFSDPHQYCITNVSGLKQCYRDFYSRINEFDSVICTNSLAAISLIKQLNHDGVRVPEDIQVATFGTLHISKFFKTSVTSVIPTQIDFPYKSVVQLYRFLYTTPENDALQIKITMTGKLKINETTRLLSSHLTTPIESNHVTNLEHLDFHDDEEVRAFMGLEQLFTICEELDIKLLHYALKGYSYERMAEKLHTSTSTVFYRLQRMIQASNFDSRASLENYLRSHNFEDMFF